MILNLQKTSKEAPQITTSKSQIKLTGN